MPIATMSPNAPTGSATELRLRALLDASVDGVYVHDLDGRIIEFSQSFADMLGYTRDEMRSMNVADIDTVKSAAQLRAIFRKEAGEGKAFVVDTRHRRKDGSTFESEISVKPVTLDGETYLYSSSRDVSERADLLRQIEAERRRLRDFSNSSADWFWELDADLRFAYFSDGFAAVIGEPAQGLIGASLPRMFARDALNASASKAEHIETLRARRPFRDFEYMFRDSHGETQWMSNSGIPFFDAGGKFAGYRCVGSMITARKRAEQERDQTRLLLQEIVDNSPYGIAMFDERRDCLIMNGNYGRILDLPKDLLERKPFRMIDQLRFCCDRGDFGSDRPRDETVEGLLAAMQVEDYSRSERRLGNGRWIERRGFALPGGHVMATYFDITSYKTTEAELREAKERSEAAAAAGIIGMFSVDFLDGRIFWDRVQRQIYGAPEKDFEITPENFLSWIHPDDIARVRATFQNAYKGAGVPPLEFRIFRQDGALRHLRGLGQTIHGADGKPVRLVGVTYDVTEQKETLAALEAAKTQAEAASKAKSEFLAHISHEIRTPLNAIVGMTQLLARSPLTAEQADYVRKLDSAGQNMLILISDVLDLSRIEAGRMDLGEAPFLLSEAVRGVAEIFSTQATSRGLALRLEPVPEDLPAVIGDATRLVQVLGNLIGNAIKFTARGEVAVSVKALERSAGSVRLRFAVRDTGIGIAAERRALLFEPFVQAESTTYGQFGGTGLGLAICDRIVRLMGGEIEVESEPGKGSEFSFVVTLKTASESLAKADLPASASGEKPLAGVRLLVVDDSETNREVAINLLALEGAVCEAAENGRIAVERIREGPEDFDVVLMDVQMPVMDGLEATRAIRLDLGLAKLPVIALTAGATLGQRELAQAAGMNGFIAKPFRLRALVSALSPWLPRPRGEI